MNNGTFPIKQDLSTANLITFILLLVSEIIGLLCTILILIFIFFSWHLTMTKALHNHMIFLLIIISFFYLTIDLPFSLSSFHYGYDRIRTITFCQWWYCIDYILLANSLFLTATASIQRHILVFHSHWLRIERTRWIFHYLPLILSILYPICFYVGFIYLYPCKIFIDEESLSCSSPCYEDDASLNNIDWIMNCILPVFAIVLANLLLISRVLYSKKRVHQRHLNTWRKQRKLTLQLLSLSFLYILGWGPTTIISIVQTCFDRNLYEENPQLYSINNSSYFVCPLQALLCIFALPELMNRIKNRRKTRAITPERALALYNRTLF